MIQTPTVIEKSSFKNTSPKDKKEKRTIRFKGKTAVITESPYKTGLEEQKNKTKGLQKTKKGALKNNNFPKSKETQNQTLKVMWTVLIVVNII